MDVNHWGSIHLDKLAFLVLNDLPLMKVILAKAN